MTIFERGTKQNLTFRTNVGTVSIVDLWNLELEVLDNLAISLNNAVNKTSKESFINKNDTADPTLNLSFDVVKRVINVRLALMEASKKATETKALKQKIMAKIAEKQDEKFSEQSMEDLQKQLNKLGG